MKISVLMATHNDERFIEAAIISIIEQTFTDFEFLIIDDFSIDSTSPILSNFARTDKRIRIVRNSRNLGLTKCLNKGLQLAKGEYVARMDGDDICHPKRLERQYAYFISHPVCVILATEGVIIDEQGQALRDRKIDLGGMDQEKYLLNFSSPFIHSGVMFSRKAILKLGGYNEDFRTRQDIELWLRALASGMKIDILKEKLIYFRFHEESISNRNPDNLYTNVLVRMLHLAKKQGMRLSKEEATGLLRNDRGVRMYVRRILARKAFSIALSNFRSRRYLHAVDAFCKCAVEFPYAVRPVRLLPIVGRLLAVHEKRGQ